jgi:hypothetical protein
LIAAALALSALSCEGGLPVAPSSLTVSADPLLVGAGDIGDCSSPGAEETAALLNTIGGTVFTAGDNAYPNGSADDFRYCYEPSWGRFKLRTRPSPGNHDYMTAGASAYFDYFGANAGPRGLGYYHFAVGEWVVFSLNSNIDAGPGSAQAVWLRRELEGLRPRCLAAIWHHPIASSGSGSGAAMRYIWQILQEFSAEIVISSHDHFYERFTPIDANGVPAANGIRLFIVGTGGAPLTPGAGRHVASEAWASVWGVLQLTLRPDSYQWAFVPVSAAAPIHDAGYGPCR